MKKITFLLVALTCLCNYSSKAQCSPTGVVHFDVADSSGTNDTFHIVTTYPNELILIAYDGWEGPGTGPVTVDGYAATHINTAFNGNNSGTSEVYAYCATSSGLHNIKCDETSYSYLYNNFAAAFYATGSSSPLSLASITSVESTGTSSCATGGSITDTISTTYPGSMIFCTAEFDEGKAASYPISWTGANFLADTHSGTGEDAAAGYQVAATPGPYIITATNSSPPSNGCGGLTIILVAIAPPSEGPVLTLYPTPDTGLCNGTIVSTLYGGKAPFMYSWSPGGQTTATITGLCAGTYCCKVTDSAGCSDSVCTTVLSHCGTSTPDLCYITCDTNSVHNIIVWQKAGIDTTVIDSVVIYRGVTLSLYKKIGEVSIHDHTEFTDVTSAVDVTSYYYKLGLASLDTACSTPPITPDQQSILLQLGLGIGHKINLNWNFYGGITVNYYLIMRDDSGMGHWHVLDSVPGGISAYTDTAAPSDLGLRYKLGLNWNVVCTPYLMPVHAHRLLAPSYTAYSNICGVNPASEAKLNSASSQINLYPSPNNGIFQIQANSYLLIANSYVEIYNMMGQKVYTTKLNTASTQIDLRNNASGVYFCRVLNEAGFPVSEGKFVMEK